MADDIIVGSVAVDIVPDTRKFKPDLEAKLQGITVDVGVNADTTAVRADLDELTRSRTATIKTNVDVGAAESKLDATARDRTAKINTRVDGGDGIVKAVSGFGALTTAAITLGPALIPIAATLGAIGIALGAPLAVAAGGATIFGFLTGAVIKQTEDQKKKIDALKKSVDAAKSSLSNTQASAATSAQNALASAAGSSAASLASARASAQASLKAARQALASATTAAGRAAAQHRIAAAQATLATREGAINTSLSARQAAIQRSQSASVESAQRKVTQAVAAYQDALKGLTPAQKRFLDAQDKLKGAFQGLIQTSGPLILGPVTKALNTLTGILPDISPVIGAVSGALTHLLTDLGNSVKTPGFKAFIATFADQVGPDIVRFGHIAGGAIKGFTGLVFALGDTFGPSVLKGLRGLTDDFARFGQQSGNSNKIQDFVDYFHRVGPQVAATIGAVGRAIGHIVEALAPLGPPALRIISGIAEQISSIPIPVLTGMVAAFGAVAVAAKVGKGLSALGLLSGGGGLGKSGGVLGQFVSAAKPVPVFVTNPGFSAGGGKTPIVAGGGAAAAAAGEAEAAKAAAAAAAAVRAAGGGAAAESQAAARAFKEAMAAHDAAVLKEALSFGVKGGARGLLGTLLAAPAGVALADVGAEVPDNPFKMDTGSAQRQSNDFFKQQFAGATTAPSAAVLEAFNLTPGQARALLGLTQLKATTTGLDSLRGSLDKASNGFDIVGHSAHRNFGSIQADARALQSKLDSIRDKKLTIILDDLRAVRSLEALQAFRFRDKTININERERAVGPGGGAGHPLAPQAAPRPSSGGGGSGGGGGALVNIEHAHVADTNDLLRKSGDALRSRAGGGVLLRPPLAPVF